jgi:hypothetical protein
MVGRLVPYGLVTLLPFVAAGSGGTLLQIGDFPKVIASRLELSTLRRHRL